MTRYNGYTLHAGYTPNGVYRVRGYNGPTSYAIGLPRERFDAMTDAEKLTWLRSVRERMDQRLRTRS